MLVLEATPTLKVVPSAEAVDRAIRTAPVELDAVDLRSMYFERRDRAFAELDAARLNKALRLFTEALAVAERLGDEELIDWAFSNRCQVAMTLGSGPDEFFGRLREILMRNRTYGTACAAANGLTYGYTQKKQFKKALFYARIARDRAYAMASDEWIVKSHNEIGNCLLSESYFEEAVEEYERALERLPEELTVFHTAVLGNLGYTKLLLGDRDAGFELLFASLKWCRRNPSKSVYEAWIHLFLCYAYIESGRWCYAWKHGQHGLKLAEQSGDYEAVKNGLYLAAEVEKGAGDIEAAYHYYSRLEREFYPESSNLPDMMLFVDTKQLVNLRA